MLPQTIIPLKHCLYYELTMIQKAVTFDYNLTNFT